MLIFYMQPPDIWRHDGSSYVLSAALHSISEHLSCDDCLDVKSEDYQNCSVLYCIQS